KLHRQVFIGDSLTRYQYLDLAFTLQSRSDLKARATQNPLMEQTWDNYSVFYNGTNEWLQPNEYCDCHRPERPLSKKYNFNTATKRRTVENRHYFWRPRRFQAGRSNATSAPVFTDCKVTISYVSSFKASDNVTGHLQYSTFLPAAFRAPLSTAAFDAADWRGERWSKSLPEFVTEIGNALSPTVIVYNTGLHSAVVEPSTARALHDAMRRASPCVIYKTTTRTKVATAAQLSKGVAAVFADGAVLDAARLTDSNTLRPRGWLQNLHVDNAHYSAKSNVYHDLNMVLLAGLYGGDALTPEMWEVRFGAVGPYLRVALNRGSCGRSAHKQRK
ncbi:hypothetical protein T492DRAFT_148572, partial [Pavlovales sp. CCMP2436]